MSKSPFSLSPGRQPFLVLLAADARRGEIHVIPYMIVSYDMDFHPCDAVTFWKVLYISLVPDLGVSHSFTSERIV